MSPLSNIVSPEGLLIRLCLAYRHPFIGKSLKLWYLYHLYPWLSDSTGSPSSFVVGVGGGSAGGSTISFSGAFVSIAGLSGGGGDIGATTTTLDTLVVAMSSTGIGDDITDSSAGGGTMAISELTIDLRGTAVASILTARVVLGIVGGVGMGTETG